jgi:hypothetical protein
MRLFAVRIEQACSLRRIARSAAMRARSYSYGVVALSIREARRLDSLLMRWRVPGICARHRRLFKQWLADVATRVNIQFDANYGEVPF